MRVKHKTYGDGIVKSISDTIIKIDFNGQVKEFQFPQAFGPFLTTDDLDLQAKVAIAIEKSGEKAKLATVSSSHVKQMKRINPAKSISQESNGFNSLLIGKRAQTIPVVSEANMFELVGYMAAPGRINSVEAEVPKDGRDALFEKMFPGQTYRPIELGNTPSGMPNKLSPQFRINFGNLRNCPEILLKNMGKGNGSCVGRINKSAFVIDIVQKYGFRFGDRQDVIAIKEIAEKRGFKEEFENGYRR